MLLADRRGGTQMIAYVVLVAGVAIAALPAARGLDASAKGSFEGSTVRFDKPGTYVGGDTGARGGGGGARAFGGDTSRGWTLEQVADAVLPNPPGAAGAVVCDPSQIGRAPPTPPVAGRPRYAIGGNRDGFG